MEAVLDPKLYTGRCAGASGKLCEKGSPSRIAGIDREQAEINI